MGREGLARFILARREEIVEEWAASMRRLHVMKDLPRAVLINHAPELVEALIQDILSSGQDTPSSEPSDGENARYLIARHALQRLDRGFDLEQAVAEYRLLRDTVLRIWEREAPPGLRRGSVRPVNDAIDRAIELCVERFTETQQRTTEALDRIAAAGLESQDLDELLRRLLVALVDSMPQIDTTAILLREGDTFRVRAAAGLNREVEVGFSVKLGEGFAGTIAEQRAPMLLQEASESKLLLSPLLHQMGVKALYGVPLLQGSEVIGVAHIGTRTASIFPEQDIRLLNAVAARATAAIYQQMLRRERDRLLERERQARASAEEAESAQRFLYEGTAILTSSLDYEETLERLLDLVIPSLADWGSVLLLDEEGRVLPVASTHRDPNKREAVRLLNREYPPASGEEFGLMRVLRTGEGEHASGFTDEALSRFARDPEHARLLHELGVSSYLIAPLKARGRTFGGFVVCASSPERSFEPQTIELLSQLAARAGLAIDNALLYRHAQKAIRLREQILAIVSHDLRTPLGTIRLSSDLLHRQADLEQDPHLERRAETILRSASRMERMISDLLDLASVQAGELKIDRRPQRIGAVIEEAIDLHRLVMRKKGVHLELDLQVNDLLVNSDGERLLQVFSNLLGNALKACGEGDSIVVRGRRAGDRVLVEVSDTGPGIAPADLNHLFDAFWTRKQQGGGGTGLGLTISKGIVEAHGGRIWASSEPGHGATFSFLLPLYTPQPDDAPTLH